MSGPRTAARYAWVAEPVQRGAVIVTANRRLSRELLQAWHERQADAGARAWRTPPILPWTAWLASLLDAASGEAPLCLGPHAGALVWERLLEDILRERMASIGAFVRQVQQAWQRINDWCVPLDELERHAHGEDERIFAAAALAYRDELAHRGWIDHAMLPACVTRLLGEGRLALPRGVVHAGFDRQTPAARSLFEALAAAGCEVASAPLRMPAAAIARSGFRDADGEHRAAGRWARQRLKEGARNVGIVCSALEQDAARITRLVREGFAPGWQSAERRHAAAVHVSYGRPLAAYPMVAVALLWLTWACRGLSTRDVGLLLRSHFAGRTDADERSRLELRLRRLPDQAWRPAQLAEALSEDDGRESPVWLRRVRTVAQARLGQGGHAAPAEWAGEIDRLLGALGWPGEKLDSLEFQLLNRWRDLLNELARLEVVRPRMGAGEALARLRAMAAETVWQAEAGPSRVTVLGVLEAAGSEFDCLWVSGLDADTWPPPSRPLALVSRVLQRQAQMPDATPADTLDYSQRALRRLVASAETVHLSWPEADREAALAPSPLIEAYAEAGAPAADPGWRVAELIGAGSLVPAPDPVPPVREGERVHGGVRLVDKQVAEPLAAFAFGRLGVKALAPPEPGVSSALRGKIVHRALCRLLADKPGRAELRAWSGPALARRIDEAVEHALAPWRPHAGELVCRLLELEGRRLARLLESFVAKEGERDEFRIERLEDSATLSLHGVTLRLRIDRIDRLPDGALVIIDYKSGAARSLVTREGAPRELQLVVYALAAGEPVAGLWLVNVGAGGVTWRGAGRDDRSRGESWDERLAGWTASVDRALAELAAGDVRLDTASPPSAGRPLAVLSRIEELRRGR